MNLEHVDMFAGEVRTLTLHARDASNNPVNLTGDTVAWLMGVPPLFTTRDRALVSKTGTVTDAENGVFTVAVAAADTVNIDGDYEHMATATTTETGAVSVVVAGRFRVRAVLVI